MRLTHLHIHNIGPFNNGDIDFMCPEKQDELKSNPNALPPVVIITGENGTGKSVILDAIRTVLSGHEKVERDIVANHQDFMISLDYLMGNTANNIESKSFTEYLNLGVKTSNAQLNDIIVDKETVEKVDWLVDYWSPDLDLGNFNIQHLSVIDPNKKMDSPFLQTFKNTDINRFICFLDYLQGSKKQEEKKEGEFLYKLVSSMLTDCLADGEFLYVERKSMMPMVKVRGKEVPIDKLSMGNLLLFNHFISTLYRMYVICERLHYPVEQVNKLKGVLLIDEIENHLHPKWQRVIIKRIQKYFPNLQLIITTHSPFVVSSVVNSVIFVCESRDDHSEIVNVTADYTNQPVDEVLCGDVFGAVGPFGSQIADLLEKRKHAIEEGHQDVKNDIEKQLLELNASFWGFLNLSDKLVL